MAPEGLPDPLRVALTFAGILDGLGDPYATAGSFADLRAAHAAPLVSALRGEWYLAAHAAPLVSALRGEWYLSEEVVRDAIARGASFNAIHLPSSVKVDVFVVGSDPFDGHRVARGQSVRVGPEPGAVLRIDTAE